METTVPTPVLRVLVRPPRPLGFSSQSPESPRTSNPLLVHVGSDPSLWPQRPVFLENSEVPPPSCRSRLRVLLNLNPTQSPDYSLLRVPNRTAVRVLRGLPFPLGLP